MPDFLSFNDADFVRAVRHQVQQVLDTSNLRPLTSSLCQILTRPGNLMAHETPILSSRRWCWLVPAICRNLNPTDYKTEDIAYLCAAIECLQIASERQTLASATGTVDGDKGLYAYYYALNQSLYSLALELALASGKPLNDCSQSLARCRSVNSTIMQLNVALQEESEQLLAEVVGEETYILTIGRRQAALGAGAAQLAAIAADLTAPEVEKWRQFGFNLGVTFELIEQLEFYTSDKLQISQTLPLKSLPFVYALTQVENEETLQLARAKGEWQLVKSLVRQSGTLAFVKDLARDWLDKTTKVIDPLPVALTTILADYRRYIQSIN